MIQPIQERILIKLKGKYGNFETTDEKFSNFKTRGIVLNMAKDITPAKLKKVGAEGLKVGDMVYFGAYEDAARYGNDDNIILLKLEDIGGMSEADASAE